MREIKHRLRSPLDKIVGYEKWYPGSMDSKNFYVAEPCWLYSEYGEFWNPKKIDHRMKDAFTGLKDKNGREIYEGDILKSCAYEDQALVVIYEGATFGVMAGRESNTENGCEWYEEFLPLDQLWDISYWKMEPKLELEVIGNIYENPELVKP